MTIYCLTVKCCNHFLGVQQRAVDPTGSSRTLGVLLCVCVCSENIELRTLCVYMHTGLWNYICSLCMWAYVHLYMCGASLRLMLMCREDCCSVSLASLQEVFLQLKTKKMTPAHACSSSIHCSALCSFQCVPGAQWDGSVKDVHIKESPGQH